MYAKLDIGVKKKWGGGGGQAGDKYYKNPKFC